MKTEEKNGANMSRVRIAVLGMVNVGKSALTVRYLTRRYIGEYRSNTDLLYRQTITLNNTPIEVEIIDVSGDTKDSSSFPIEQVEWADGCVVVYSITDRQSFEYAVEALSMLRPRERPLPVALLANKADLEHLRVVQESEGKAAAQAAEARFYEVSVAENSSDIYLAFESLFQETRSGRARKFSVSKMIGSLMGGGKVAGAGACGKQSPGGTVMVCRKADLASHRNRVLKRRQHFTATASL